MELNLDGEGFLVNRDDWSEEVAKELARRDDFEIDEQILNYIVEARKMYENDGTVPPIRKFSKAMGVSTNGAWSFSASLKTCGPKPRRRAVRPTASNGRWAWPIVSAAAASRSDFASAGVPGGSPSGGAAAAF